MIIVNYAHIHTSEDKLFIDLRIVDTLWFFETFYIRKELETINQP